MDHLDPVGGRGPLVCPKTGKPIQSPQMLRKAKWLFPIAGLISLLWFLIRVVPKPSRAEYPCQRAAAPLASAFVVWLLGWGAVSTLRTGIRRLQQARFVLAGVMIMLGIGIIIFTAMNGPLQWAGAFTPTDPVNTPIGVAKGIHPGRVSWVRDVNAVQGEVLWDNSAGYYWDDAHNNQPVIDAMMGKTVRWLTGETSDPSAWDALFRYYNNNHGKGNIGYQPGEKIVIKVNLNNAINWNYPGVTNDKFAVNDPAMYALVNDQDNESDVTPQAVVALLRQLINQGGVPPSDIYIYDSIRYWTYKYWRVFYYPDIPFGNSLPDESAGPAVHHDHEFDGVHFVDCIGLQGREKIQLTATPQINYSIHDGTVDYLPTIVTQADYMINFATLKKTSIGITCCNKNHYGSLGVSPEHVHHLGWDNNSWPPVTQMGTYSCFTDYFAHKDLGGKTFLYLLDGLWAGWYSFGAQSMPHKWQSLNNDWPKSFLASQDGVAIDSVALDFLRTESPGDDGGAYSGIAPGADDYLHEAALADHPPSGTVYQPDGIPVTQSLGVHEHWNNGTNRQYSRNLGTGNGIELISCQPAVPSVLQIGSASANYGGTGTVTVPITMVAQGTESAVGFSLQYDTNLLSNPVVALGSSDAAGTLNVNTSQTALGKLGIAIAQTVGGGGSMPSFAAGTDQIATVTFTVKSVSDLTFTTVNFTTQPINPEVVDAAANDLDVTLNAGTVMIPYGYEADVMPRPSGKNTGTITIQNWVQVGRFAAGLDTTTTPGEFQRADCAPRGTCGDGKLTMADWVQAGRYAIGLDPVARADGPWTTLGTGVAGVATAPAAASAYAPRSAVSLQPAAMTSGRAGLVYVLLNAQGNESALGFTLNFDPKLLRFTGARLGSGAGNALLNVNTANAGTGAVGIGLAFPLTRALEKGKKLLVALSFVPTSTRTLSTKLRFSDQVITRELANANAADIPVSFTGGSVMILGKR